MPIMFELCMHDPIMSSQDLRLVSCHGQGFDKRSGMCMHFIMHVIFGCSAGSHSLSHSSLQQQQATTTTTTTTTTTGPLMCHARSQFLSCQVKPVCPCELHGPDMWMMLMSVCNWDHKPILCFSCHMRLIKRSHAITCSSCTSIVIMPSEARDDVAQPSGATQLRHALTKRYMHVFSCIWRQLPAAACSNSSLQQQQATSPYISFMRFPHHASWSQQYPHGCNWDMHPWKDRSSQIQTCLIKSHLARHDKNPGGKAIAFHRHISTNEDRLISHSILFCLIRGALDNAWLLGNSIDFNHNAKDCRSTPEIPSGPYMFWAWCQWMWVHVSRESYRGHASIQCGKPFLLYMYMA